MNEEVAIMPTSVQLSLIRGRGTRSTAGERTMHRTRGNSGTGPLKMQ